MTIVSFLIWVLKFCSGLLGYLDKRQLLDAGAKAALGEAANDVLDSISLADKGRQGVDHPSGPDGDTWAGGVRDKYSRH